MNDGSIIILRVAIVDARVRGETSPFGAESDVNATGGVESTLLRRSLHMRRQFITKKIEAST